MYPVDDEDSLSHYIGDEQTCGLLVLIRPCPKLVNVDATTPAICEATT
jgi:hypothetical protein